MFCTLGTLRNTIINESKVDALLNTATLAELQEILGDELQGITELFAEQVVKEAAALDEQVQQRNLDAVARHAHAMKGSCGNVGAMALSNWAATLEKIAKTGDHTAVATAAAELPDLLGRSLAAMREAGYLKA